MTRGHRAAHRILWSALAIALAAGLAFALAHRPPTLPAPVFEAAP